MGYKMKGSSLYGSGKKPSVKKTDGIGEGFMNPPYRGPESKGPRAKRQGYDGYTNFTSNVTGRKVHKDAPKSTVHGVDNPGNWQPHQFRKKSPVKAKDERVKIDGKMYPKGYTKKDVKFLKSQKEDVVRYEDLDAKGRAIWKKQGKAIPKAKAKGTKVSDFDDTVGKSKKSPAKFEEVVPRKMPSRIKTRKTPKRKMPKLATGAKIPMALKLRKTEGRGPRA